MHARPPALPPLRHGGAAVVLGAAMLATLLPAAVPARGGEVKFPALAVTAGDAAPAAPDLSPFVTTPGACSGPHRTVPYQSTAGPSDGLARGPAGTTMHLLST